jgi:hypothetical protein
VLVQRVNRPAARGGKSTKFEKIPLVTFKRMISQTALDPKMIQVGVDELRAGG